MSKVPQKHDRFILSNPSPLVGVASPKTPNRPPPTPGRGTPPKDEGIEQGGNPSGLVTKQVAEQVGEQVPKQVGKDDTIRPGPCSFREPLRHWHRLFS